MPHGSIREAWLARLYIQAGDPLELGRVGWLPLVILGWAISDEIIWRGWLQPVVTSRFGVTRGVLVLTAAYTAQSLPSIYYLADPSAGYNPLISILAACCGLCFSYITHLAGRITPSLIAHATLAYFTILEFRPGL
ncbi:MAG: CPBP family intramembrane metalloprotease [Polyangiaceae bacterium]